MPGVVDKVRANVQTIGNRYFLEPTVEWITGRSVDNFKLALLGLTYAMRRNALLCGEYGFGKTTASKLVMSAFSGVPLDFYDATQVQGHPEQTKEEMAARLDFSAMSREEKVIYQAAVFGDGYLLDELPRLPQGKQAYLLHTMEQGRWMYLNDFVDFGKRSFFATANYEDGSNHRIMPALLDRFDISLELGRVPGGRKKIREYTRNQKELENRKVTDAILEKINDNSNRKLEKRQFVIEKAIEFSKELARKGLHRIDDKEMDEFQTLINKMDLDPEADMYIDYMECDLNMTQILGQKRREDPMDPSTHAKGLASSCVRSSFSPRAYASALEDYSRALALYMGDKVVQRPHVVAVAPYVMAHRMEFDKDWASQFTEMPRPRGENMKTDLSRNLLKVIETSFDKNHQMMQLLDNYAAGEVNGEHTLSPEELRKVLVILHNVHAGRPAGTGVAQQPAGTAAAGQSPPPVPDLDHPFLREYALGVIDTIKKKNKWV